MPGSAARLTSTSRRPRRVSQPRPCATRSATWSSPSRTRRPRGCVGTFLPSLKRTDALANLRPSTPRCSRSSTSSRATSPSARAARSCELSHPPLLFPSPFCYSSSPVFTFSRLLSSAAIIVFVLHVLRFGTLLVPWLSYGRTPIVIRPKRHNHGSEEPIFCAKTS